MNTVNLKEANALAEEHEQLKQRVDRRAKIARGVSYYHNSVLNYVPHILLFFQEILNHIRDVRNLSPKPVRKFPARNVYQLARARWNQW